MQRQQVRITTAKGSQLVDGYVSTEFPGIGLHRAAGNSDWWTATHVDSGLAVASMFSRRKDAAKFAAEASALTDFTMNETQLTDHVVARPKLRQRLRELAKSH